MIPAIVNPYIAMLLASILWSITGCAKHTEEPIEKTDVIHAHTDNTSAPVEVKQKKQTIEAYLTEFSIIVKTENWDGLADITDFPIVIRGELDDEGSVDLDRKIFVKFIGQFFQEEVYLTINDELVASTYRDLMVKPIEKPKIENDIAEIHGFRFIKKGQSWKLKQITTYVHIVEKFMELNNEHFLDRKSRQ